MTNNKFINTLTIILILFLAILGGSGCDGGHSSNFTENSPDAPNVLHDNVYTVTFDSNGGSEIPV